MNKKHTSLLLAMAMTFALGLQGCSKSNTITPTLSVTSDILGLADTSNKSTLKQELVKTSGPGDTNIYYYAEDGKRTIYENQEAQCIKMSPVTYKGTAILDLGENLDDSKIDSSNAKVYLIDGNGYYAEELILSENAQKLDGPWEKGKYTYTLNSGDLEWNNWDYYTNIDYERDYNSGREWSMMGGDGNGVYYFTLEVSGITYDGNEVPAAKIPFAVYIYGRSSADLGLSTEFIENTFDLNYTSGKEQSNEIQWVWYTENQDSIKDNKPYLNDPYSDYFSVIWPEGTDGASITAKDVTVTLSSKYGDEYVLSEETAYGEKEYAVISHENETEIIVTYQQWAYIPVYSTMTISVQNGEETVSTTYDISSVTAYMVQTGGGGVTVDHTVTTYNYYGVENMTLNNAANIYYTLSTIIDGTTYYYAEDENGNGYLSMGIEQANAWGFKSIGAPEDAWKGDGTEKYHIAVCNNVVFVESRLDNNEEKTVDGQTYTFTQSLSVTKNISDMIADGAKLVDGYNLNGSKADKWPWTFRYQAGWTIDSPEPTSLPYYGTYPFGYESNQSNPVYDGLEVPKGPGGMGKH